MKRREFLKTSTAAAIALAGSQQALPASTKGEPIRAAQLKCRCAYGKSGTGSDQDLTVSHVGSTPEGVYLPKQPLLAVALRGIKQRTRPMPLSERISRGIVPKRGVCTTAPSSRHTRALSPAMDRSTSKYWGIRSPTRFFSTMSA